ncbi:PIR Superfamily Protein [Plasmodium ovale wallikeri]|uniref:PIR Superfamily Protein n=1 Tax=Plasmodium ovale wallikeri TaxID=864142 RepID=A0A1A9AT77_PLAOA|nr:PIR Superfamily Protein [Plasmodium ovale wallikeri]SBT59320.1 PIR Superfamily Protein [Plasmodium ovale wallikeri]
MNTKVENGDKQNKFIVLWLTIFSKKFNYNDNFLWTEIFKYFHLHTSDEEYSKQYPLGETYSDTCSYKEQGWEQYHTNVCEKLKKLIHYFNLKKTSRALNEDSKYIEYLNFLLHFHVKNDKNSKFDPSSFYEIIKKGSPRFFWYNFHINIRNIEENMFTQLKLLYNMYEQYYKIYNIYYVPSSDSNSNCISYANTCVSLYNSVINTCKTPDDSNFCIALDTFKKTYDELKSQRKCGNVELPSLSSYEDVTIVQKGLQASKGLGTENGDIPDYISAPEQRQPSTQKETPFAIFGTALGLGLFIPSLYRVNKNSK